MVKKDDSIEFRGRSVEYAVQWYFSAVGAGTRLMIIAVVTVNIIGRIQGADRTRIIERFAE
uniref:Uncharacterized protein n=1 Tax=Romanomermis culicivorax TaxID=13658 RepID=A0A915KJ10_ROMCU